jgi:PPOX class probable F420-dependent enzyme
MPAMDLPDGLLTLLRQPSYCFVATSMPAGSPQLTQTWVDTDGTHIILNCVQGSQKVRNIERDPRVALNVVDPQNPFHYYAIRGRVVDITTDGAADHIDTLAERYTGKPYQWYRGRDQIRLILTVRATRIGSMG